MKFEGGGGGEADIEGCTNGCTGAVAKATLWSLTRNHNIQIEKAGALPPLRETLLPIESGDLLALGSTLEHRRFQGNARWVWITPCRQTRQIVASFVGDRSARGCTRVLRERFPPAYRRRATRSDYWLAYDETFPRRTHRCTGKGASETCSLERWNYTLRQFPGRFVRKTLSFSHCDRLHELALRWCIPHHNLPFN